SIKETYDQLKPRVDESRRRKDGVLKTAQKTDQDRIGKIMEELDINWEKIDKDYTERYGFFQRCMEKWRQFHCDMRDLASWLTEAETTIQRCKTAEGRLNVARVKEYLPVLEEGIANHQGTVTSLNSNGEEIVQQSSAIDGGMLRDKLYGLNARWKGVCAEVASWKERFDVGQDEIDAFLKEVDIVNAWLDGCKELTTSRPSPGDEKALQGSLRIVKEKQAEQPAQRERKGQLLEQQDIFLACGKLEHDKLTKLKLKIADLTAAWDTMAGELSRHHQQLKRQLEMLASLDKELTDMEEWLKMTKESLTSQKTMKAQLAQKKLLIDAVVTHRDSVNHINAVFLEIASEADKVEREMPEALKKRIETMNNEWERIQESGSQSRSGSDMEDDRPIWIKQNKITDTITPTKVEIQRSNFMEINGNDISDKVMEFDKMVAELRDWLVLLDRTLRTQPVTVGDLEEIEETIARQKKLLQDLAVKRPQLEDLVKQADRLQGEVGEPEDQKTLQEKVDKIKELWDAAKEKASSRTEELQIMLSDSQKFHELTEELMIWLTKMEKALDENEVIGTEIIILQGQLETQKAYIEEIESWKPKMTEVQNSGEKLSKDFTLDDAGRIEQVMESLMLRWTNVCSRSNVRLHELECALNSLQDIDKQVHEFLLWLGKVESPIKSLERKTHTEESRQDREKVKEWQGQHQFLSITHISEVNFNLSEAAH
ncbi:dystrophin-like protein, partial [Apostichopus japonicus]